MNKVIIFTQANGNLAVCYPTGEKTVEEVLASDCNGNGTIIDYSSLPQDHDFFNAWELDKEQIIVNFEKAKNIIKDRLRIERTPLLAAQDVAFQKALESGADTKAIVVEKQRLRDLPTLTDSCQTLDELRALKP